MEIFGHLLRTIRPPKLTIELVPKPCWGRNVRTLVSPETWRSIQKAVFDHAGGKCQVCGWPAAPMPYPPRFHCHEIWHYNDWRGVQKLEGFVALCRFCHEVKHIGLARAEGRYAAAIAHLAKVNGWSRKAAFAHADACFDRWEGRSRRAWVQDLAVLCEWLARQRVPPDGSRS
jgi:hypothetical protein